MATAAELAKNSSVALARAYATLQGIDFTTTDDLDWIIGMPFHFLSTADPNKRAFTESYLRDLPILHLVPGKLKYKTILGKAADKLARGANIATFGTTSIPGDDKIVRFDPTPWEYQRAVDGLMRCAWALMFQGEPCPLFVSQDGKLKYTNNSLSGLEVNITSKKKEIELLNLKISASKNPTELKKRLRTAEKELDKMELSYSNQESKAETMSGGAYFSEINKLKNLHPDPDGVAAEKISNPAILKSEKEKELAKLQTDPMETDYDTYRKIATTGLTFFMEASSSGSEEASSSYGESDLSSESKSTISSAQNTMMKAEAAGLGELGGKAASLAKTVVDTAKGGVTSAAGKIFGGGANTIDVINGAMPNLPEIWQGSQFSKDFSVSFRFHSPYGDRKSIFNYVYLPMIMLLAFALPRAYSVLSPDDFVAPFLIKADAPGNFCCELGVISSLTIKRGGDNNSWSKDGLPTVVDITLNIKDILPAMMMSTNASMMMRNHTMKYYLMNLAGTSLTSVKYGESMQRSLEISKSQIRKLSSEGIKEGGRRFVKNAVTKALSGTD
jgi:hypothetical protein